MRNTLKHLTLAAAFLALATTGAFASDQTSATIGLTATVSSFDNITCVQSTLDLNGGVGIAFSGLTGGQAVNCSVSSNDDVPVNLTAYMSDGAPLTGTNPSNTIANTNIEWSATSGGTYVPFAALSGDLAGNTGAVVVTGVESGDSVAANFFLALNVPPTQAADTYSGTLTVAITPGAI